MYCYWNYEKNPMTLLCNKLDTSPSARNSQRTGISVLPSVSAIEYDLFVCVCLKLSVDPCNSIPPANEKEYYLSGSKVSDESERHVISTTVCWRSMSANASIAMAMGDIQLHKTLKTSKKGLEKRCNIHLKARKLNNFLKIPSVSIISSASSSCSANDLILNLFTQLLNNHLFRVVHILAEQRI